MKTKALTPTQSKDITTDLRLGVEFLIDALKSNPEIWESSAFRCGLSFITEANKVCNERMETPGTQPTIESIRKAVHKQKKA